VFSDKLFFSLQDIDQLFKIIELHRIVDVFEFNDFNNSIVDCFEDKKEHAEESINCTLDFLFLFDR